LCPGSPNSHLFVSRAINGSLLLAHEDGLTLVVDWNDELDSLDVAWREDKQDGPSAVSQIARTERETLTSDPISKRKHTSTAFFLPFPIIYQAYFAHGLSVYSTMQLWACECDNSRLIQ
jgi:hypothetical protein